MAISSDEPRTSALLVGEHFLPYPLLSDPTRETIEAYGVLNPAERGGVAIPAIFAVAQSGVIKLKSIDTMVDQLSPRQLPAALSAQGDHADRRRIWFPRLISVARRWLRLLEVPPRTR